jgi:hypothetical protein
VRVTAEAAGRGRRGSEACRAIQRRGADTLVEGALAVQSRSTVMAVETRGRRFPPWLR